MAETHELRLKINAAAARAGAREFVAAINAIKSAVTMLDRSTTDAFDNIENRAKTLGGSLRGLSTGYTNARAMNERFAASIKRTNAALSRQISLAAQARGAMSAGGTTGGTTAASGAAARASDQQISLQNRVKRAVDDTRLSVERLTTSLMRVGGFQAINEVSTAFRRFQKEVGGAAVSAQQLDSAKTRLNSSLKAAQTSLVTLTAKAREDARAQKEAAAAAKQLDAANRAGEASARAAAAATRSHAAEAQKQVSAQLAASNAMRQAEQEVARLTNRLRAVGDNRGITNLNQSLIRLKANLSGTVGSAMQVKQAMGQFADATSRARIELTRAEGAKQAAARRASELANQSRTAANAARQVERELRSIAGASNAASQSMRQATGSMRGMENAFSATFQVGSAFRTLIGSITFGTFIQGVFQAGRALEQFRVTMEVATGSVSGAMEQMDFIDGMARELGTNLRTAREDFAKFAVAANLAGVETEIARDIFRSVSQAMTVMGRGTEDQRLAFLALEQMLSKNTISSEELRRQLGERLPGAVALMAKAVGVTTAELQDMLKAGELVSSEVLPKFAAEVDKAFGPGLDRALTRAPAALGRFRNEIEFFLSAIADTGLMDELAEGFDRLTDAMRSPEAREAAVALGQGLSDLTSIAVDFAEAFITNIDTVGAVAKAVIGGLIVRQVALLANALLTQGAQMTKSLSLVFAGMGAAAASTDRNTKSLVANDTAAKALAARQRALSLSTKELTAAQLRASIVSDRAAASMTRFGIAAQTAGRATSVAAKGMTGLSRILGGLGGPLGIAITALTLLPLFMNNAAEAATDMADDVEEAVRRAGVSLDELSSREFTTASRNAFNTITDDLETLEAAYARTGATQQDFANSVNAVMRVMSRSADAPRQAAIIEAQQDRLLAGLNIQRDQLTGLSDVTQHLVEQTLEVGRAASEGEKSWLAFFEAIQQAVSVDPASSQVLGGLEEMIKRQAEAELASAAHREQLTLLFGTDDDKATVRFAQMALAALRAGEGFEGLRKQIEETEESAPNLARRYTQILDEISNSFARGISIPQIRLDLQDDFGDSANDLVRLREEFQRLSRFALLESQRFAETSEIITNQLRNLVPSEALTQIQVLTEQFKSFEDVALPVETLAIIMEGLTFPTESATAFADAVQRQFSLLSPAQQTYDNLRIVMTQVAQQAQFAGQNMDEFANQMATAARAALDAGVNAEDLRAAITAVLNEAGVASDVVNELVGRLFESADASSAAERAAYGAENGLVAAANGADQIADGAAGAAAQVRGLIAALNALSGSAAGVAASAAKIVSDINFQAQQKAAPVFERARNEFIREQTAAITETYNAALKAEGASDGPIAATIRADMNAALAAVEEGGADIAEAARNLYETEAWRDPNRGGRSGGGRRSSGGSGADDAASATERLTKAIEGLEKSLDSSLESLNAENNALMLLASGFTTSERAARALGEAQAQGVNIFDEQTAAMVRQIEAAEELNRALTAVANDPVNDWMNSVPTWREAGQQIEEGVLNHLSDAIANFIKTGEFSFEALGEAILGTIADIIADKAVKELVDLFGGNTSGTGEGGFGLGGLFADLFGNGGSRGDPADPLAAGFEGDPGGAAMQNAILTGSQQGSELFRQAIMTGSQQMAQGVQTGGQTAATTMQTGVMTGGTQAGAQMGTQVNVAGSTSAVQMGTQVQTSGTVAAQQMNMQIQQGGMVAAQQMGAAVQSGGGGLFGGGGGLFGGGIGGILLGAGIGLLGSLFSGGGDDGPDEPEDPVTPVGVRTFAEGTPNTSGIPAVLHDNEAVIPLTKGRKVPVEMDDDMMGSGNGSRTVVQNFNITTPDADSFRKSQKQIAADAATSGRKALSDNG